MNIFLWILQVLLCLMFVMHSYILGVGYEKTKTQQGMKYVGDMSSGLRVFIAVCELLGGIGLILPALTGILPQLTPLAATGVSLLMIFAAAFHIPRREYQNIVFNLILLAMATFVAYGRFVLVPFGA